MKIYHSTSFQILFVFLAISSTCLLAQTEEEYDDLYFMASDRNVIAKNALLKAEKEKETLLEKMDTEKDTDTEEPTEISVRGLDLEHQSVSQIQQAGGLARRPQLMISLGQTFGNQYLWNDPFHYASSRPYFGAAAFDPWGRNYFYRYGWNPSAVWYSNQYFAPNYYSASCPTYYSSPSWISNRTNSYSRGNPRKVYKGARNSRNTGFPTYSSTSQVRTNSNSSLINLEKETQIKGNQSNPRLNSSNSYKSNSWQQDNSRRSRSVSQNPSNSGNYNQKRSNNPSRNSWSSGTNNNRNRSSSFGSSGRTRSSSGGSKSNSRSSGGRTRGRN